MRTLARITADPEVMGGRPCIRGIRVTVGTIVGLVASGHSREEILSLYPYLEPDDITEALAYAAWRSDEFEVPISPGTTRNATAPDFYSINETKKPATQRVYHNNSSCPPGRDIPLNERRSGRNDYRLCADCRRLNAQSK